MAKQQKHIKPTIKLPFDHKRLIYSNMGGGYDTVYGYYYENPRAYKRNISYKDLSKRYRFLESKNKACFAAIHSTFNDFYVKYGRAPNRLGNLIYGRTDQKYVQAPTDEVLTRYLEMLKRNSMLPKYFDVKATVKHKVALFKIKGESMRKLAIYLNMFRYLREHKQNIPNLLYLNDELGMNFFIAFVLNSYASMSGGGHNIMNVGSYGDNNVFRLTLQHSYKPAAQLKYFMEERKPPEDEIIPDDKWPIITGQPIKYATSSPITSVKVSLPKDFTFTHEDTMDEEKVNVLLSGAGKEDD